jgi:hypothetical protein
VTTYPRKSSRVRMGCVALVAAVTLAGAGASPTPRQMEIPDRPTLVCPSPTCQAPGPCTVTAEWSLCWDHRFQFDGYEPGIDGYRVSQDGVVLAELACEAKFYPLSGEMYWLCPTSHPVLRHWLGTNTPGETVMFCVEAWHDPPDGSPRLYSEPACMTLEWGNQEVLFFFS